MRQVQNHSEKDLIMKATDIELQSFKDLDVYDTLSRKTIPRGAEIIYSHIVFDKKYSIQRRSEMYSWNGKHDLCLMGANRNLMKTNSHLHHHYPWFEHCWQNAVQQSGKWDTKTLEMPFVLHHWKGDHYMWSHQVDYQTQQRIPSGSSKRQFMDWKTVTDPCTTCRRLSQ